MSPGTIDTAMFDHLGDEKKNVPAMTSVTLSNRAAQRRGRGRPDICDE